MEQPIGPTVPHDRKEMGCQDGRGETGYLQIFLRRLFVKEIQPERGYRQQNNKGKKFASTQVIFILVRQDICRCQRCQRNHRTDSQPIRPIIPRNAQRTYLEQRFEWHNKGLVIILP